MKINKTSGNPDIDRYRRHPGPIEVASDVLTLTIAIANLWFILQPDSCGQKDDAIVITIAAIMLPALAYLPAVFFNFLVKKTEENIGIQMLIATSMLRCMGIIFAVMACISGCGTYFGWSAPTTDFADMVLTILIFVVIVVCGVLSYLYK